MTILLTPVMKQKVATTIKNKNKSDGASELHYSIPKSETRMIASVLKQDFVA